ncbi:MAG: nicotinate (nicotinamide) nucleotide adenylyltransferase [Oscillospiraceae bacterium]|nr:nicotinate (nicotinamide) nucleotide adenylyltransferase [Oscillospiraceae bacterium]
MRIALYGGSFNPPHLGHLEAVRTVLRMLSPDRLLVIPDREPPHKELEDGSPTAEERFELCRLCFGDLPGVEVSDLELRRQGKSYTYETIREMESLFPDDELILVVGTDMFLSFEEWYHFEYLFSHCRIAVLSREMDDQEQLFQAADRYREKYAANLTVLSQDPLPMSSTEIRTLLRRRAGSDCLPKAVYAQIIKLRLYGAQPELSWLREQVYPMLDEWRIAHVAGCEGEAIQLARYWGEDPELAAEAGILHDMTKRLSLKEQLILCEKYDIICDDAERNTPKLLHAKTGAVLASVLFGSPEEVCEAIRWHTTGKADMTLFEKLLYLADYIEPTRDFPGIDDLRTLAYRNLDEAMVLGLRMTIQEIRSGGKEPYIDTLTACEWYENRLGERRI